MADWLEIEFAFFPTCWGKRQAAKGGVELVRQKNDVFVTFGAAREPIEVRNIETFYHVFHDLVAELADIPRCLQFCFVCGRRS